jgi:Na+-driven multidrug efflux pump
MKPRHQYDITKGSMARSIWHLAWPSFISQMLLMFPSIYDVICLGQLGPDLVSAFHYGLKQV